MKRASQCTAAGPPTKHAHKQDQQSEGTQDQNILKTQPHITQKTRTGQTRLKGRCISGQPSAAKGSRGALKWGEITLRGHQLFQNLMGVSNKDIFKMEKKQSDF